MQNKNKNRTKHNGRCLETETKIVNSETCFSTSTLGTFCTSAFAQEPCFEIKRHFLQLTKYTQSKQKHISTAIGSMSI